MGISADSPSYHPLTETNFRRLHDDSWSTLLRAGQAHARDLSAEDVKDALQHAFLQLWRHHGVHDEADSSARERIDAPAAWLCKAMIRRLLDIRHARRREVAESTLVGDSAGGAGIVALPGDADVWLGKTDTPDAQFEERERAEWVKRAILKLREAYRSTLVWFYFHGASYEEIIARWKAHPEQREYTADSIAKIKLRGMKMLRELLAAEQPSFAVQQSGGAR